MAGLLIAFEGGEGVGKSTHVDLLRERSNHAGYATLALREPGGTALGEYLRTWLKDGQRGLTPEAELLLFVAARAELVRTVIRPALAEGRIVVMDRFEASTLVYQGYARQLPIASVRRVNALATGGLSPNLTVLLDAAPSVGLRRASRRPDDDEGTRFEEASLAFHRRVRAGFLRLARRDADRWVVLDATASLREVADAVWCRVEPLLAAQNGVDGFRDARIVP